MFNKKFSRALDRMIAVRPALFTVLLACAASLSQPKPAAPSSAAGLELPVTMRQNVGAGKTPVGTKVQAKLAVATLVNGAVIPQDATFSGEVTESVAKSATNPSLLAIRMDTAQWRNGAAPTVLELAPKLYLTAWYYPVATPANHDLSSDQPDAANTPKPLNGAGAYPGPRNPTSPPFSGRARNSNTLPEPPTPASSISKHRVLMKNVESTRNSEGAVTLTSKHSNIKLDRTTTYVLAAGDLLPPK